jgi:glutamyl-tRNA synthetase
MSTPVRARFAPSPTGLFHVGSARSALWNWLFARQHDGAFVLRIEDTDEARNEPQWVEGIRSAMRWLELDWDEEYVQSANAAAHRAAAERLLAAGRAYYCDCTAEAVAARKAPGAPPGYDGFCRDRGLGPGPGRAIRFRIPEGRTELEDVVRGHVEFDNDKLGGDFVIVKANGGAVFYLANTVDDLDEGITHVLRGEEHLSNTPKNQLLWEALTDRPPPVWAHLNLLVNAQRKKLSKRRDRVALESYRDDGYLMEALRNYLCLLGWAPKGDREFLTLEEMLAEFRLEDVGSSPAFFDIDKLTAFNEHYIRELTSEAFVAACAPFLASGPWRPEAFDPAVFAGIAPEVQPRIKKLSQVPAMVDFLFLDEAPIDPASWQKAVAGYPPALALLTDAVAGFGSCEWTADGVEAVVHSAADGQGLALGKAQAPIRVAVTGRTVGPPLWPAIVLLGRDRVLIRLEAALDRLRGAG